MPRETKTNLLARAKSISQCLSDTYPDADCSLNRTNALEMLISTILSAQCTDKRVNIVTKNLFKKYRTVADYAHADILMLQNDIRSTGFFRNKAKNILAAAKKIIRDFDGNVPATLAELITLPGVGRKTANCVLGNAFGINEGFVVDTHVARLAQRLELTSYDNPIKIERDMMNLFSQDSWSIIPHQLIAHGRKFCQARKPLCPSCPINKLCPSNTAND